MPSSIIMGEISPHHCNFKCGDYFTYMGGDCHFATQTRLDPTTHFKDIWQETFLKSQIKRDAREDSSPKTQLAQKKDPGS